MNPLCLSISALLIQCNLRRMHSIKSALQIRSRERRILHCAFVGFMCSLQKVCLDQSSRQHCTVLFTSSSSKGRASGQLQSGKQHQHLPKQTLQRL